MHGWERTLKNKSPDARQWSAAAHIAKLTTSLVRKRYFTDEFFNYQNAGLLTIP
jgi:hypothetical protein